MRRPSTESGGALSLNEMGRTTVDRGDMLLHFERIPGCCIENSL